MSTFSSSSAGRLGRLGNLMFVTPGLERGILAAVAGEDRIDLHGTTSERSARASQGPNLRPQQRRILVRQHQFLPSRGLPARGQYST